MSQDRMQGSRHHTRKNIGNPYSPINQGPNIHAHKFATFRVACIGIVYSILCMINGIYKSRCCIVYSI